MKRASNGDYYYKYDGYPEIIAVREGSAADRAGLRIGDVITKVNGRSILDEEGSLQRAEQQEQIRLVVRRDGKDLDVLMLVTR
jgi:C-terminal processing protease CtpA/Prc